MRPLWALFAALVLAQIGYPLTSGGARAALVVVTVVLGYLLSVSHAAVTRGRRVTAALVVTTTAGGLLVEAVGVATGLPFGRYAYTDALGPRVFGVPLVIPLAWTWMAWPSWVAATRLAASRPARVALAGTGLAAWDLFLDPQMVGEGYWRWADRGSGLPGVPAVPVGNYLGWLVVAVAMMALFAALAGDRSGPVGVGREAGPAGPHHRPAPVGGDAPMLALYLWTYVSSIVAHAVFLDLPASAAWGALGMGLIAVPLAVRLARRDRAGARR